LDFYRELKKKTIDDKYRFHMPGHKGKKNTVPDIFREFVGYDFTEIDGTDNLNNPKGIIKKLQDRLSKVYGTKKSYILVNGSTSGLQSAILSQTKPKDKILIQRDSHKAIYNSLILGDIDCEFIWTEYDTSLNLKKPVDLIDLEKTLDSNDIKLVVVTYPTYYGICSNIEEIAKIVHSRGALLIVDEAHGGHFKFSEDLPIGAEDLGADIVVQSLHKTLPALTQTSAIHVCSNRVDILSLESFIKMIQTSSPSYLLMLSVEGALDFMDKEGRSNLSKILEHIRKLKNSSNKEIFLKKSYIENKYSCKYDETKLLISFYDKGIKGSQIKDELKKQGVYTELWDLVYNVAYITPADSIEDITCLFRNIENITVNKPLEGNRDIEFHKFKPVKKMTVRDAFYKNKIKKDVKNLENEISGDFIIPYPPGIPIICPGELIEDGHVNYIKRLIDEGIEILGVENDLVTVLRTRRKDD